MIKLQSHRWSDFLTANIPLSEHRHRPDDVSDLLYECDDHDTCSTSSTPICKKEYEPCSASAPDMLTSARVRSVGPPIDGCDSRALVEVLDASSSSPSDAAAESASDTEVLDCAVGMCEEHGLLAGLAGGADDDDMLGIITADADYFAAGPSGVPAWASAPAARDDGRAAVAVPGGDCAVRTRPSPRLSPPPSPI